MPKSPTTWMPLYPGDYLRATLGLSRAEHGSYVLLIMAYWDNGGPLDDDDGSLREIAKCPAQEWMRTRGLMLRYFDARNGKWHHKRIDEELNKARERSASLSERGKLGASTRWDSPSNATANSPANSQSNATANTTANAQAMLGDAPSQSHIHSHVQVHSHSPSLEVQQLRSAKAASARKAGEQEALEEAKTLFGETTMANWGGKWRKRHRENPDKFARVMADLRAQLNAGVEVENPGGYADDLWRRFQ